MKKIFSYLLTAALLISLFSGSATAQIPNNGFEDWDSGLSYDNPTNWDSPNATLSSIPFNTDYVVFEETDSVFTGTSALKMESKVINIFGQTLAIPGFVTLGDLSVNTITNETSINGGTPFTGTPQKLVGQYNYAPAAGDACLFEVVLLNYDVANSVILDTIAAGYFTDNAATSGWEAFEATLIYFSTSTPNYMNINILCTDPTNIMNGSVLYVDDLSFITSSTSVNDILSFELPQQIAPATIDATNHTVNITVAGGTDVTSLSPTITISTGATITPASGAVQDFTLPVTYTVTSSTGTVQIWTVTVSTGAEPDLFISEYIEGSSNNKAMEIYNPKSTAVSLDDYVIRLATNGGGWSMLHSFPAGAVLNSHDVWVIITNQVDTTMYAAADADEVLAYAGAPSVVHFNGDDARALCKIVGSDTIIIDQFGDETLDPGDAWPVAGTANGSQNHTLLRKTTTLNGNTDWAMSFGTDPTNSEWIVMAQNDFSDLGMFMVGGNVPPSISAPIMIPAIVTPTDTVLLSATITDVDGTVTQVTLDWGLDGITFPNNLPLTSIFGLYSSLPNAIPAHPIGTEVFYKFEAIDDDNDTTVLVQSYIVESPPVVASIYEIQGQDTITPFYGQIVTTTGIVTALLPGTYPGYFIQDGDGAWNGLYVFDSNVPTLGDEITITGEATEYYNLTQLKNLSSYNVNSSGNALPNPVVLSTMDANDEAYECVFVRVEIADCTNDDAGFGMWELNDGSGATLVHNNAVYSYTPTLGLTYNVQGVMNFTYDERKIELRMADDVTIYTSIEEMDNEGFVLYPNPASSILNIRGTENIANISVYNIIGEELQHIIPQENIVEVNVQNFVPGIYFVKIQNEDGSVSTQKFIKK